MVRTFCDKKIPGESVENIIAKPGKQKFKKTVVKKTNNLEEAAKDVASLIQQNGGEQKNKVQAELLSKLLGHINSTGEQKSSEVKLR